LDLSDNGLAGIGGRYYYDSVFNVSSSELDEFETLFPHKEKHITDTQLKIN